MSSLSIVSKILRELAFRSIRFRSIEFSSNLEALDHLIKQKFNKTDILKLILDYKSEFKSA